MFYFALFIGILIGGEIVLVPALYSAFATNLSVWTVIGISLLATIVADSAWYSIGRFVPYERVTRLPLIRTQKQRIDTFGSFFDVHAGRIIFTSKFIYGTRVAVQLSSGIRDIEYLRFIVPSVSGTFLLTAILAGIIWFTRTSLGSLEGNTYYIHITFAVVVALIVILHILAQKVISRFWSLN